MELAAYADDLLIAAHCDLRRIERETGIDTSVYTDMIEAEMERRPNGSHALHCAKRDLVRIMDELGFDTVEDIKRIDEMLANRRDVEVS